MSNNLNTLTTAINTVLSTVQVSGSPGLALIYKYPANQFTGYPAATIVEADVSSDYANVIQNTRRYSFEINVYYQYQSESESKATAYGNTRTLVDAILDALDKSVDLGGACDFLIPVPMAWEEDVTQAGLTIIAPIRLTCQKDVSVL